MKDEALHIHTLQSNLVLKTEKFYQRVICEKEFPIFTVLIFLMWTSSWAINGYIYGCEKNPWSCHPIEHQMSAVYNITHGLGLAIVTPRWMEFVLDENNAKKFC